MAKKISGGKAGSKKKNSPKRKKNGKRRQSSLFRLKWLLLGIAVSAAALAGYIAYCFVTLPDIAQAVSRTRQPYTTIIAENGDTIHTYGSVYSEVIYPEDLPVFVKQAVISTEDRRFYSHSGFDIIAFTRAMLVNLKSRRYVQGGSTITQQVAKNLFLTPQKNIKRKVQELLMAFWLEHKFSKDQILTLYLNRVYMGSGTYGIEAASQKYFHKTSRDLNLFEAAVLAGLLKAPARYNPLADFERARNRAAVVLQNMVDTGAISVGQKMAALKSHRFAKTENDNGERYFSDWVYGEVNAYIGERETDVNVFTTLDRGLQSRAEQILREALAANRKNNVSEGAIVVLDTNGAVKAMVGGTNYDKSQFNRATQALRQPGSAFKTFVYLQALVNGFGPNDTIEDKPIKIGAWQPTNYDKKTYGKVTLEDAFVRSLNLATVNLAEQLNRRDIIALAQKMGITSELEDTPALALGSSEVKVLDMAVAYSAIASGGFANWPYSINEIYSQDGRLIYQRDFDNKQRILPEDEVEKMKFMLEDVINRGTGKRAQLPFFVAGKSGTSQDYRDAWFVGFSKNYVTAVWVGNDDNSPMKGISGGGLPAEIWQKVMLIAESR